MVASAAAGEAGARERLVEAFWPGIMSVARMYRHAPGVEHAELTQEGVVGLLRALERYDTELGTPFWAYASWWVRQAMQQLVAELTRPVVLSDRASRQLARLKRARSEHVQAHRCEPSVDQMATATGFTSEQIGSLVAVDRAPRTLDEPAGDDDVSSPGELLADPGAEHEYERVEERLEIERLRRERVHLVGRERHIVTAHYGLDCRAQTLREIAGGLGLSVERVRQIEERALGKLREAHLAEASG
ncbi:MAG: polymerase primary sigma factor [Thermoleophilaceae bacterium]|jgi:RNA polymerase sigma factor (sigma-70 family)|nr:polymerase primary sigma factor [Thermoleophilaceae bacterium]